MQHVYCRAPTQKYIFRNALKLSSNIAQRCSFFRLSWGSQYVSTSKPNWILRKKTKVWKREIETFASLSYSKNKWISKFHRFTVNSSSICFALTLTLSSTVQYWFLPWIYLIYLSETDILKSRDQWYFCNLICYYIIWRKFRVCCIKMYKIFFNRRMLEKVCDGFFIVSKNLDYFR